MNSQNSPFPIPLAIAIPQTFANGDIDLGLIRSRALRAEELGYHSLWVGEQLVGSTPTLEPVTFLSHISSVTEKNISRVWPRRSLQSWGVRDRAGSMKTQCSTPREL